MYKTSNITCKIVCKQWITEAQTNAQEHTPKQLVNK